MHIMIDIPEAYYEALRKTDVIVSGQRSGKTLLSVIYNAIANGIPLPKWHGDLVDRGMQDDVIIRLNKDDWQITMGEYKRFDRILFEFPVVIPAEKDGD